MLYSTPIYTQIKECLLSTHKHDKGWVGQSETDF